MPESQVAVFSGGARHDAGDGVVAEELQDRRLQAVAALGLLVDLHICQAENKQLGDGIVLLRYQPQVGNDVA